MLVGPHDEKESGRDQQGHHQRIRLEGPADGYSQRQEQIIRKRDHGRVGRDQPFGQGEHKQPADQPEEDAPQPRNPQLLPPNQPIGHCYQRLEYRGFILNFAAGCVHRQLDLTRFGIRLQLVEDSAGDQRTV